MLELRIPQLTHAEQNYLDQLVQVWTEKRPRNLLRSTYYDTKNTLRDLRISLPPSLARAESMLSWPAKAVQSVAARSAFDGFVVPGDEQDPLGLMGVLDANAWDIELPQAIVSSLIHTPAFISVTAGDVQSGEPDVLVLARSSLHGSGLWDRRRRGVPAALAISDTDDMGDPIEFVLYLPDVVVTCAKQPSNAWLVDRRPNPVGRVLVTPLPYRPELDRPFGSSRVSRSVMALTDAAVRTFVRAEVGAEFYASPQRYILGADPDSFSGEEQQKWRALVSRMLALSKDEDGDVPTIGQFPQMSMQPHNDQLRMIAGLFCGETGLSLSSVGIVHDQPASAEAIFAEKEELIIECNSAHRVWGASLRTMARNIVAVRDGSEPDELDSLQAKWRNPATPSVVSSADAFVKMVSALPWLAESEVALEFLGFDEATRTRLLSDKRRFEARQSVQGLGLAARALSTVEPVVSDTPVEVERGDTASGRDIQG